MQILFILQLLSSGATPCQLPVYALGWNWGEGSVPSALIFPTLPEGALFLLEFRPGWSQVTAALSGTVRFFFTLISGLGISRL